MSTTAHSPTPTGKTTIWVQTGLIALLSLIVVVLMTMHNLAFNRVKVGIEHSTKQPDAFKPAGLIPGQTAKEITPVEGEAIEYSNALKDFRDVRSKKLAANEFALQKSEEWLKNHTDVNSVIQLNPESSEPALTTTPATAPTAVPPEFTEAKELLSKPKVGSTELFNVLSKGASLSVDQQCELYDFFADRHVKAEANAEELYQEVKLLTSMCQSWPAVRDAGRVHKLLEFVSTRRKVFEQQNRIDLFCEIQNVSRAYNLHHVVMLMPINPPVDKEVKFRCMAPNNQEFMPAIFRSFDVDEPNLVNVVKQSPNRALPTLELAAACKSFPVGLTGWIRTLYESQDATKIFYVRQLLCHELPPEVREQLFPIAAKRLVAAKQDDMSELFLCARDAERLTTPTNASSAFSGAVSISKAKPLAATLLISGALCQDPVRSLKSLVTASKDNSALQPLPSDPTAIVSQLQNPARPQDEQGQGIVRIYLNNLRDRTDRKIASALVLVPALVAEADVIAIVSKWGGKQSMAALIVASTQPGMAAQTKTKLEAAITAIQSREGQNKNGK